MINRSQPAKLMKWMEYHPRDLKINNYFFFNLNEIYEKVFY